MELAVAQVTDFSNQLIEQMTKFIQKKYKAPRFEVRVHNDFSKRRTTSCGGFRNGNNFVSLALLQYAKAADAVLDNKVTLLDGFKFHVHSANPVGAKIFKRL